MNMETVSQWDKLPDHIIIQILLHLPLADRYHAAITCSSWHHCFESPYVWRRMTFNITHSHEGKDLEAFEKFGSFLQHVILCVDQGESSYRELACKVLYELSKLSIRRLRTLKIKFLGDNPIFFAGKEFVEALTMLISRPPENTKILHQIQELDLSGFKVPLDDAVINILSENHRALMSLNIINSVLVCKVSPASILNLLKKCRSMRKLCIYNCSMSEDILRALMEDGRSPMDTLVLKCRREEKYRKDESRDLWKDVTMKLPDLRVTLIFDYTCPLHRVSEIMIPEIPVSVLRLETFTYIYDEVRQATRYYSKILTKMVLNTPLSRNAPELNKALLELATDCQLLRSLHVFCVLDEDTVNKILEVRPVLQEMKTYTLKFTNELAPWVPGEDCGEDE